MKKQLHACENRSILNKYRNQYKYGFPFNTQSKFKNSPSIANIIVENMKTAMLCCAMHHCFFYWGATSTSNILLLHIGLIIFSNIWAKKWKKGGKCEPCGALNLKQKIVKCLGLQIVSQMQLQFISSLIITKLVSPTKVALTCLQILVVQKHITIKYINSKPLDMHTKI
jgi:hypothetical protein